MKKIYHLANCSTCQRIIKEWLPTSDTIFHEIKTQAIGAENLDHMAKLAGSFEALFSRKALKYRALGLHEKQLTEQDYRNLILEEYTFLKRPVAVIDDKIFIGNTKAVVAAAKPYLHHKND